jgi:hypothetical protein
MNLEHQGIKTDNRREGTLGLAGNDAKFLTSYGSSALILKYCMELDNFIIGKTKDDTYSDLHNKWWRERDNKQKAYKCILIIFIWL